jgi:acetyl esterase/lipase
MGKARAIKYTVAPDGGTTQPHLWNTSGTNRSWFNYQTNSFSFVTQQLVYRYADDTPTWDGANGGPDIFFMWVQGLGWQQPATTIWGHFIEQSKAAYGTTCCGIFTHPSGNGSGGFHRLLGYARDMVEWVRLRYGTDQQIVMGGHSAGAHLMCYIAQEYGYPWVAVSPVLDMSFYNDVPPWDDDMDSALAQAGYTVENVGNKLDVPFTKDSPPGYIIWSPDDDVVNPAHSVGVVAKLKNLGVDITYDEISTTVTVGEEHVPLDGMNLDTFRNWMDRWRV